MQPSSRVRQEVEKKKARCPGGGNPRRRLTFAGPTSTSIPSSLATRQSPQTPRSCLSTRSRSARTCGSSLGRRFICVRTMHLSPTSRSSVPTSRFVFKVHFLSTSAFNATSGRTEVFDKTVIYYTIGGRMQIAPNHSLWRLRPSRAIARRTACAAILPKGP
jgi:hypothetical protein